MPKTKVTYSERWHFKVAPEDQERLAKLAKMWGVSRSEAVRRAVSETFLDVNLPMLASLKGIAPNATGGLPSEVFVRRVRDAW